MASGVIPVACAVSPFSIGETTMNAMKKRAFANGKNALDCILRDAVPKMPSAFNARAAWVVNQEQETETTMYEQDTRTEVQQAKDYLIKSLDQAMHKKEREEVTAYGLEDKPINTVGELRQAEKDGWLRFNIAKEIPDTASIYSWYDYVQLTDPNRVRDEAGFDKAMKQMKQDASDVKDQIVVMGPEKGLEALNEFKAKSFH